ncbi:hypothetical protein OM255_19345 [Escherichia albertii]|nr:hypothetical protein [Shigella boydii]MCZ8622412.1 hypothetical protein [Escherichia albertii]EFZ6325756.1 hypothetical protein [Shigella boydii]EFZ8839290.1 hypothetical protein [Shigella boydii]MCZ8645895.1 hypothetical protein [Escherichia albertii]
MKIINLLIGNTFHSLIIFSDDIEKNHKNDKQNKLLLASYYSKKPLKYILTPSFTSISIFITIIMMLNISFIPPYTIIIFNFNIPMPFMAALLYIPTLIFFMVSFVSFKLILKGECMGLMVFKHILLINWTLFCLSMLFSLATGNVYWEIKIANAGMLLLCRYLMNSYSFDEMIKHYIYRRLLIEDIKERV